MLCEFGRTKNLAEVISLGEALAQEQPAVHVDRTKTLLFKMLKTENDRALLEYMFFAHAGSAGPAVRSRRMYDDVRMKLVQVLRPVLSEPIEEHRSFVPGFVGELYVLHFHSHINLKFRQFFGVFTRYCEWKCADGTRRFLNAVDIQNAYAF